MKGNLFLVLNRHGCGHGVVKPGPVDWRERVLALVLLVWALAGPAFLAVNVLLSLIGGAE